MTTIVVPALYDDSDCRSRFVDLDLFFSLGRHNNIMKTSTATANNLDSTPPKDTMSQIEEAAIEEATIEEATCGPRRAQWVS